MNNNPPPNKPDLPIWVWSLIGAGGTLLLFLAGYGIWNLLNSSSSISNPLTALSQKSEDNNPLFPITKDGKIGFINNQGKLVIEAKYDLSEVINSPFPSDGIAAVRSIEEKKCGYIDKTGKTVINFRYSSCYKFSEGLALVSERVETSPVTYYTSYYIDKLGTKVIDLKNNGFNNESYISSFSDGLASFEMNGKIGFMDKSGKVIIQPQFYIGMRNVSDRNGSQFSEGLALVLIRSDSDQSLAYIDKTGRVVIKASFVSAGKFSEGLAAVSYRIDGKTGKFGYIDVTGKTIIQPRFDVAGDFSEGLALVVVDKKVGYIDKSGTIVVEPKFDEASKFSDGMAAVKLNNKWGFIDKSGRMLIEPIYKSVNVFNTFSNGLSMVGDENNAIGYIDKSGKYVWNPTK